MNPSVIRFIKWYPLCALIALAMMAFYPPAAAGETPAIFPTNVQRVVFLGDSITYAGNYVCAMEAWFRTRHPGRQVEFINVGLPSETVSGLSEPGHAGVGYPRPDLHERLARVLTQTKPDLVFACYGMNDGIYEPLDEARFQAFRKGIVWLHATVEKAGAKIIHLTPPVFDESKGGHPGYAAVLDRYSEWLASQHTNGWQVIDLHTPMKNTLASQREKNPAFAFAGDGIHPNAVGHWLLAKAILIELGATDVFSATNAADMMSAVPHGAEILSLIQQRQTVMKDAWLTAIGHKRQMKPGLPLAEAELKSAELEKKIQILLPEKK